MASGPSQEVVGDPDPTTQTPWPSSRKDDEPLSPVAYRAPLPPVRARANVPQNVAQNDSNKKDGKEAENEEIGKRRLSTFNLFNLSISMAGAQMAWTVELGCVILPTNVKLIQRTRNSTQIWDALLVVAGPFGAAHKSRLACRSHQRSHCSTAHR